jgi:hypothetical protein
VKEIEHLGYLIIDGIIILKWILKRQDVMIELNSTDLG